MVIARFYVSEVARRQYGNGEPFYQITLQAVSRGPENREWAEATPSGTVTMTVKNGPAGKWFDDRLGQDVALQFSDLPPA